MKRSYKQMFLLSILVLMTLLLTACSSPEATYKSAQDLLAKGKYAEAANRFESLGSYEEAATLTIYCKACALCEEGNFEIGIAALKNLGDYKDSKMRITYYTARSWDEGSVGTTQFEFMQRAKSIYNENPLYLDSATRIKELDKRIEKAKKTLYNDAVKAGDSGKYDSAVAIFERLDSYEDSARRSTYYSIRKDESGLSGDDQDAIWAVADRYNDMGEYLDAPARVAALKSKADGIVANEYAAIDTYITDGKFAEAEAALATFGDYGSEKVPEKFYLLGESLRAAGDYDNALEAFTNAGDYNDAATQFLATCYAKGEALRAVGDYDNAIRAFALAGDYNDAATQISETYYQQAAAKMNAGDYSAAYSIFSTIRGYKDVATLLTTDVNLKFQPGKYVTFGSYPQTGAGTDDTAIEWLVLAREGNKALLISRYALDCQQYYTSPRSITWEKCSLRTWLNNTFLNKAFDANEQSAILTTTVTADENPIYGYCTDPGNATQDKVFLLSVVEAETYFKSMESRACKPTAYAEKQGAKTSVSSDSKGNCVWWLRSPGEKKHYVAYVETYGYVELDGEACSKDDLAVRPALWVNLESGAFNPSIALPSG